MIGAPGAGKSTYAKKLAKTENAQIVSGDDIRMELYGDAAVQGDFGEIWDRIDEAISECSVGNVIVDGTHYNREYREKITWLLRSYGYENIEAVVIDSSEATCLARNFQRIERNVPDYVVKEIHAKVQKSLKKILEEDFTRIHFVY